MNHNLIGRLCRGISEKVEQIREFHANSDTGAMDIDVNAQPSYVLAVDGIYVREKLLECPLPKNLAMCLLKAVYRADMGSVAALRWILPVVELVENLVLQE